MAFGRLGVLGGGLGKLGAGFGASRPSAPVLAMDPAWTSADNTPDFTINVDDTVSAGSDVRLQIQLAGGNWSSPIQDIWHTITALEDAANSVPLDLSALSNASYEARSLVRVGSSTSGWSNVVSFTISASTTAGQPTGLLLTLTKAA